MSGNYIPLYRKYRPQTLDTLVGQEHVKKTLTSAIELNRISHAYLFTGPRGTGKTSTARILAKSLNCKNGPTIHPCGECESCKDIANSVPIDVIEIDAASNRKVEDAQNILEKVQYVPVNGRYKIYIIDEVHMLTNHAFNALLKTLEEPPENVIFILATTEVHKVLDTIKSRCQRFDFRRITTDDIVKHLRYISDEEKINISDDALFAIAKNSAGGMRDSISLLDQLSLLGVSKQITTDDVNAVLGRISFDILFQLSSKIISSSHSEAIELLNNIYNSGNEPLQILTNLSEYFKNLLIVKTCAKDLLLELTGLNDSQISELSKQKENLETQQIVFLIERISYYIKEVKAATNQHLWLEIGIIDLANMTENTTLLDLQRKLSLLESGGVTIPTQTQAIVQPPVTRPAPIPPVETKLKSSPNESKTVAQNVKPQASSEDLFTPPPMSKVSDGNDLSSRWQMLLANIKSPATQALLKLANPIQIEPNGVIITFKNDKLVSQINDSNKKQLIIDASNAIFNQTDSHVTVRIAQAGDEKLVSTSSSQATKQPIEKPKIESGAKVKETTQQSAPQTKTETSSQEQKQANPSTIDKKDIEKIESDQERMVMELFDGKYVE
jgi:DNA polymerase-3 subunit gamma/tau